MTWDKRQRQLCVLLVCMALTGNSSTAPSFAGPGDQAAALATDAGVQRFKLPHDGKAAKLRPALAMDRQGRVVLAWSESSGSDEATLFIARSSEPGAPLGKPSAFRKVPLRRYTAVMGGKEQLISTSLQPRLAAAGNKIYLGWAEPIGETTHLRFVVACSSDGGSTFSEPISLHGDEALRPGFTALTATESGHVAAAWLDSRYGAQQPFFGSVAAKSAGARLESLVYSPPGNKGVCPCCDVDVVMSDGIAYFAFRNALAGNRDVYVTRSRGTQQTSFDVPRCVPESHWKFSGCPHDGPSLAVAGDRLVVAWTDAHVGHRQVYVANSPTDEFQFKVRPVVPVASSAALHEQGHPRIVIQHGGAIHVVWEQRSPPSDEEAGRAIMYANAPHHDADFSVARPILPKAGAFQNQPAIAVAENGDIVVAWTEVSEVGSSIVLARFRP